MVLPDSWSGIVGEVPGGDTIGCDKLVSSFVPVNSTGAEKRTG